jgi:hypothetical protein
VLLVCSLWDGLGNLNMAAALPTAVLFNFNDLQQGAKALCIPFGAVFIAVMWHSGHRLKRKPYALLIPPLATHVAGQAFALLVGLICCWAMRFAQMW